MASFWQFLILGLAAGSLYALTAHGLVLVYRGSGVLNFAQGAFGMIGAFVFYKVGVENNWPTVASFAFGLAVSAFVAAATYLLLMARLRRASALMRVVATLGVMFLLLAIGHQVWGQIGETVSSPLPHGVRHPFSSSIFITEDRLWLIALAFAITAVLSVAYRYTRFGRVTEAVAENPRAAAALGYSPVIVGAANWAVGGMLAATTGILIAPVLVLQTDALTLTVLGALAAALIGRFSSFWMTLAGALAIGVTESLLARFVQHSGLFEPVTNRDGLLFGVFSAQGTSRAVPFLAIVVLLVVSGRSLPLRGELLDRLPSIGSGAVRWRYVVLCAAMAVVVVSLVPNKWAVAIAITAATGIVLLSVVLVTGYVGQLSLAQVALGGLGAWIAGRLVDAEGWSFGPALLAGVLLAIPIGVLFAIPAVRARGINLAVLTFGLSVAVVELVLSNSALNGGFNGTRVGDPSLFGLDVGSFNHPGRWAILVVVALVACMILTVNIRRGRTGRRLIAVRCNERAAASLGVDVTTAKLYAFAVGAAFASFGGILLAFRQRTIAFGSFGTLASIQSIVLATIGGIGYILGAVFGGLLAPGGVGAQILAGRGIASDTLEIISGIAVVFTVLAHPNGVAHSFKRNRTRPVVTDAPQAVLPTHRGDDRRTPTRHLVARDVTVSFGGVVAVDHVSLAISPGEVLGIIGPNGAGKTTLLDAITGFAKLREGSIQIDDVSVHKWAPHRRARYGIARSFQALELFDDLTVRDNILVACDAWSPVTGFVDLLAPRQTQLNSAAWEAVDDFGLLPMLDRYPSELSYGQRRLVAIARSVASDPDILFLDEPAAGLSEQESRELATLIRSLAIERGIGIALIEHDMALITSACHRLIVLDHGAVIAEGLPDDVVAHERVVAAYLGGDKQPVE